MKKLKDRSLGHDLEKILDRATVMGLTQLVAVGPDWVAELRKANGYYPSKGYEYFRIESVVGGYQGLPDIDVLDDMATVLVEKLEAVCLQD